MDTKNIVIICLAIVIVVLAMSLGFLMGQQESGHNAVNVTNNTNITNATNVTENSDSIAVTSPADTEETTADDGSDSSDDEEVDYNSPDSKYYRWDTDGSYHEKEEGGNYVYAPDAITGEWSYWANKT